ncbi:BREX-1 system phosphatase PglZ type A [Bacillus sp. AFS031507]|uniref:BREX-1 system phosphatase PglZ type A n=1 Tax=Bacillus sp. AFS031507 TaxID=2033496 RepID=UPI000BFD6B67|nr:BREX-1 system phosphatase PglZ type A [Bacillus sp. AFS031507]PGY09135.1 TIGR02687 family protein [Bacillus sp. AFS031507]
MNIDQIITTLTYSFNEPLNDGELRKIIFWVDKDKEFVEEINNLYINNVKIHHLTEQNNFYSKYLLEEEEPTSHYLVYTNDDINVEENWLIDTVYYSKTFYADKISLLLDDLGIDSSLRAVVKKYEKFFNKKHSQKFKSYGVQSYTEEAIEIGIMSVLCNMKTPDFEELLKTILKESLAEQANKYIGLMEKYFDVNVFWKYVSNIYGYDREDKSLKTLFMHLAVTTLSHTIEEKYLSNIMSFVAERNKSNALVFIDHWMHHKTDYVIYNELADMIEQEIKLTDIVNQLSIESFMAADTFPYFDKAIIIYIANALEAYHEDYEEYIKLINLRRVKHFYEKYQFIYEALFYTVKMYEFYKKHSSGIPKVSAVDMWNSYVNEYHAMDTYYRKFYVAFDNEPNSEILKKLKAMVENLYTNWYMGDLSSHWSHSVESDIKDKWTLPGITNQQDFYRRYVAPKVHKGERIFVIISDALRYEVGVELADKLNAETMGACEIEPILSVVPSITKLGMASLLPHREIVMDENARVLVDGKSSSGIENRKDIIESTVSVSVAVHAQEMLAMNKAGRREYFKGKKLIYIYHDTIDAMGDKASTEIYTFSAVERAIDEISTLVKIIRDDLSGTNILITADHGFVYQREALVESDKIEKEDIHAIELKRRYMLSQEKRVMDGILTINMNSIIKNEHQLTVYVPKATIRFKIQGSGVNFVHGGASLQEVVVPLIQFKNVRRGQANSREIVKVDIKLTNTIRKITNSLFHLSFFQTEKVEEKLVPRTVMIYMADDDGSVISNEETIIGDRTSNNPEERTFKLRFALKTITYDKNKHYYLTMKDLETGVILEKIPFNINLGIVSEFDF